MEQLISKRAFIASGKTVGLEPLSAACICRADIGQAPSSTSLLPKMIQPAISRADVRAKAQNTRRENRDKISGLSDMDTPETLGVLPRWNGSPNDSRPDSHDPEHALNMIEQRGRRRLGSVGRIDGSATSNKVASGWEWQATSQGGTGRRQGSGGRQGSMSRETTRQRHGFGDVRHEGGRRKGLGGIAHAKSGQAVEVKYESDWRPAVIVGLNNQIEVVVQYVGGNEHCRETIDIRSERLRPMEVKGSGTTFRTLNADEQHAKSGVVAQLEWCAQIAADAAEKGRYSATVPLVASQLAIGWQRRRREGEQWFGTWALPDLYTRNSPTGGGILLAAQLPKNLASFTSLVGWQVQNYKY